MNNGAFLPAVVVPQQRVAYLLLVILLMQNVYDD